MAGNTRVLTLRAVALVIWLGCVLLVVLPAATGSSSKKPASVPFTQPQGPPGPHPRYPVKQ